MAARVIGARAGEAEALNRTVVPGSSKRERARKPESVAAESVPAGGGRRRVGPTRGAHTSAAGAGRKGRGAGRVLGGAVGPRQRLGPGGEALPFFFLFFLTDFFYLTLSPKQNKTSANK